MKDDSSPQQAAEVMVADVPYMTPAVCQQIIGKIAKNTEDAFYLMNASDIIAKYQYWMEQLPAVQPFYAVKCNNHPLVLQLLNVLGCNFDCASKSEIETVMEMGVDSSRIIFANPCKPVSHLRYAQSRQVDLMTFDNASELYKIQQVFPRARLVIRIRMDAEDAQCPLGTKFGVSPGQAEPLLKLVAALQLQLVGVSFHVGSGCREPAVFERAICAARDIYTAAEQLGIDGHMHLLDIGGGFPGSSCRDLDACAQFIRQAVDTYFPAGCGVRVIAEPGRYMVQSAFQLATQVVSVRRQTDSVFYYVNDGVYGAFNCVLYDHQVCRPRPLHEQRVCDLPSDDDLPVTVFGPTCDSMDCICVNVRVSSSLTCGDWLLWRQMGAYTLSASGTFNGFPRAAVHVALTAQLCDELRSVFGEGLSSTAFLDQLASSAVSPAASMELPQSPPAPLLEACCVAEH